MVKNLGTCKHTSHSITNVSFILDICIRAPKILWLAFFDAWNYINNVKQMDSLIKQFIMYTDDTQIFQSNLKSDIVSLFWKYLLLCQLFGNSYVHINLYYNYLKYTKIIGYSVYPTFKYYIKVSIFQMIAHYKWICWYQKAFVDIM